MRASPSILARLCRTFAAGCAVTWAAAAAGQTAPPAEQLDPVRMEVTLAVTWTEETIGNTEGLNNTSATDTWVADVNILAARLDYYPACRESPCGAQVDVTETDAELIELQIRSTSEIPADHPAIRFDTQNTNGKFLFDSNGNGSGFENFYYLDMTYGRYIKPGATGYSTWRRDRRFDSPVLPAGYTERTTAGFVDVLRDPTLQYQVQERFVNNAEQIAFSRFGTARVTNVRVISAPTTKPPATCRYQAVSDWGNGFVGFVYIKNETAEPIQGWQLDLQFAQPVTLTNVWSSSVSGTGSHRVATPLAWNQLIYPGQEINFGFQGSKQAGQSSAATVSGGICR